MSFMPSRYLLFSFLLLLAVRLSFAQPGGGGGMNIAHFYSAQKKLIQKKDTSLQVRCFILQDCGQEGLNPTVAYEWEYDSIETLYSRQRYPSEDYFLLPYPCQRLLITYQKDTMLLDVMGISLGNGGGWCNELDSLIIRPGYYRYNLHDKWREQEIKWVSQEVDLNFLKEENVSATFLFTRATYENKKGIYTAAERDLLRALTLLPGGMAKKEESNREDFTNAGLPKPADVHYELAISYYGQARYEEALKEISQVLDMKDAYAFRINIYIKLNRLQDALKDYNTLVQEKENYYEYLYNRAQFKINYLNDYKGAREDAELYNQRFFNPRKELLASNGYPALGYYLLGIIEGHKGKPARMAEYWMKVAVRGYFYGDYQYGGSKEAVARLDSMMAKYPKQAELHLIRAIAYTYELSHCYGDSCLRKELQKQALAALERAGLLGLSDYRIILYRAAIYYYAQEYEVAMAEVNKVIALKPDCPWVYELRYHIKSRVGLTRPDDPDWLNYEELLKTWNKVE